MVHGVLGCSVESSRRNNTCEGRPVSSYSVGLDNASTHGTNHLGGLAGMFDHFTQARITESVSLAGARCLELGAGNGSIAVWLADQVGPDGEVIATDIDTRHIPEHDRLTILRHDLLSDPLPAGPFDLTSTPGACSATSRTGTRSQPGSATCSPRAGRSSSRASTSWAPNGPARCCSRRWTCRTRSSCGTATNNCARNCSPRPALTAPSCAGCTGCSPARAGLSCGRSVRHLLVWR